MDTRATERRRAAVYLDLWERHLTVSALNGKGSSVPEPKPDE